MLKLTTRKTVKEDDCAMDGHVSYPNPPFLSCNAWSDCVAFTHVSQGLLSAWSTALGSALGNDEPGASFQG